jgi:hypothetical protein
VQHADFFTCAATLTPIFLVAMVVGLRRSFAPGQPGRSWLNFWAIMGPPGLIIMASLYALAFDVDNILWRLMVLAFALVQVLGGLIVIGLALLDTDVALP